MPDLSFGVAMPEDYTENEVDPRCDPSNISDLNGHAQSRLFRARYCSDFSLPSSFKPLSPFFHGISELPFWAKEAVRLFGNSQAICIIRASRARQGSLTRVH